MFFQAENIASDPNILGKFLTFLSLVLSEKSEINVKTCLQKTLWAKWFTHVAKTKVTKLFFTPKSMGNAPNTLKKSKTFLCLGAPLNRANNTVGGRRYHRRRLIAGRASSAIWLSTFLQWSRRFSRSTSFTGATVKGTLYGVPWRALFPARAA